MKEYTLSIIEKREYSHDVTIRIDDDSDIDAVCDMIEDEYRDGSGNVEDIGILVPSIKVAKIELDDSPDSELEIESYDEVSA